jgi:hypothetical protein
MTLRDLEEKWRDFLQSDASPPVLGLAPVPESEIRSISAAVHCYVPNDRTNVRFQHLLEFLHDYPATAAVWLTRQAAEAYDFGTFWRHFEEQIGFTIPSVRREELAVNFSRACRRVMLNYIEPRHRAANIHVEPFLFQARLPLCHCSRFADLVRDVE